jgi:hypothetical protein
MFCRFFGSHTRYIVCLDLTTKLGLSGYSINWSVANSPGILKMNNSNVVTLSSTEDVRALERELGHFERFQNSNYKWSTNQKLAKVNIGQLLGFEGDTSGLPMISVPTDTTNLPTDLIPKRDSGYIFTESKMRRIIAGLVLRKPICLVGPMGCGKSTVYDQFYALLRQPAVRIQATSAMDTDYLFSSTILSEVNGATVTAQQDGHLTGTRRNHVNIMIDEFTHFNEDVSSDLNTFLEMTTDVRMTSKGFSLEENESQIIRANRFQDVWLSSNTGGRSDTNGYHGNRELNASTMDRLLMIDVDYMNEKDEMKVFENKLGPNIWIGDTVKFMNLVRNCYKQGGISKSLSTRSGLDFLAYTALVGDVSVAFCDTILAKFEPEERQEVVVFLKTSMDTDIKIPDILVPNSMFDDK